MIRRLGVLLLLAAVPAAVQAAPPAALRQFHAWRAVTDRDGETAFEPMLLTGASMTEFGTPDAIMRLFAGHARSMILIAGKPGFVSARHNVGAGREIVLVLAGSATALYGHGKSKLFHAGDLTLFEDHGSKGRAVRFGPDGYLAVTVPLADGETP